MNNTMGTVSDSGSVRVGEYNKARALACLDNAVAELVRLRECIEELAEELSARDGTDMDAFDCGRCANEAAGQCNKIGVALGHAARRG